jgi:AraC-like DNA-binding protein
MIYHWHEEYEIIRVDEGKLEMSVDGQKAVLESGDCAVVSGDALHGGIPEGCVYECLMFDINSLSDVNTFSRVYMNNAQAKGIRINPFYEGTTTLAEAADRMFEAIKFKTEGYYFTVPGELLSIVGCIFAGGFYSKVQAMSTVNLKRINILKSVITFIEEHYNEHITLDDMAQVCSMNSNYFNRAFKAFAGRTPVEYLNYYRIESACEQIINKEGTIMEISERCGFSDYSYFIKVFKKFKGCTPKNYVQGVFGEYDKLYGE